jgi:hypothetical protein
MINAKEISRPLSREEKTGVFRAFYQSTVSQVNQLRARTSSVFNRTLPARSADQVFERGSNPSLGAPAQQRTFGNN